MGAPLPDGPIDTFGVLDHVLAGPDRLAELDLAPASLPATTDLDNVVVATGPDLTSVGRLVAALVSTTATIPVLAHAGGPLPAFVGPRTLVIDVGAGVDAGAAPVEVLDVDATLGRFDTAELVVRVLGLLEQLGLYAETTESVAAAVTQLRVRRDELTGAGDPARRLARRIGRTLPIVYGTGVVGPAVAAHWKAQINRNAKVAAFANAVPGVERDEIAGWGQHGDMTRQVFTLVLLRHDHEPDLVRDRIGVVTDLVDEVVGERHELHAAGQGTLAQVLDLVFWGDVVSWHLAQELEIDPGPVAAVETLRA